MNQRMHFDNEMLRKKARRHFLMDDAGPKPDTGSTDQPFLKRLVIRA
jgi:hypothetical protein